MTQAEIDSDGRNSSDVGIFVPVDKQARELVSDEMATLKGLCAEYHLGTCPSYLRSQWSFLSWVESPLHIEYSLITLWR